MDDVRCGATTRSGTACRYPRAACPHHQGDRRARTSAPHRDAALEPVPGASPPPGLLSARNIHELLWWAVERLLAGDLDARTAATVTSFARLLLQAGPAGPEAGEALREVVLRGRLMYGIPPATDEDWELARRIFDDDALAEIRRWPPLAAEGDGDDHAQPLRLRERAAYEVEMPGLVDDEDGIGGDFLDGVPD